MENYNNYVDSQLKYWKENLVELLDDVAEDSRKGIGCSQFVCNSLQERAYYTNELEALGYIVDTISDDDSVSGRLGISTIVNFNWL